MQRRLSLVVLLALIASLIPTPGPGSTAYAATFRNIVAQVPATPGTGSVRIWMNSDTALGETAGIEYNIGSSYVKVLGTFDTSYPGANWRADIPGQLAGTLVRYQLFTRNQSGGDYDFTGFNWGYTTSAAQCAGTAVGDNNVFYAGLFHDSFSASYRSPIGPVKANQSTVTLRFRTCQSDVQGATVRVWNDRTNSETLYTMAPDGTATDPSVGPVQFWSVNLPISSQPTILYYTFRATDGSATGYYRDDDPKFLGGGFGQAEASQSVANDNSYQLTVFDPLFSTPEWMQRAVIYQIFPDRFRDGNPANNPQAGRFSYGGIGATGAIVRSNDPERDWNSTVCDPRAKQGAGFNCANYYGDNFYGGDLKGITQKLEDGYFSSLGVTLLYLNPIFRAPSNHKYDTANFMEIDPDFGTLADFQAMVAAANARGIRVMLDGVFNHTSSDSPYFDRYGRYAANGTLNDADGGTFDGSGACEAVNAEFRSWFYFEGDPNTTVSNSGKDGDTVVRCAGPNGTFSAYEAWYGYSSLPKIRSNLSTVRDYFYGSADAVGPYWTRMGAAGWRFDVGADVDPGLTNDAGNDYWEGFRAAVRDESLSGRADTVMLGEEWGDGSPWLLGNEWDSVMNYRFRSAVLGWMFTGCSGNGCTNGSKFQENDSNDNSSSGAIFYLSPSQFNARLRSIQEDYPANAFKAMMNLPGSHDTQRVRFLLKKINNDNDVAAVQRMKEWWLFAFAYAGAPTLYYGDEVGLSHDGVWDGSQFQDDPYNRAPFPWPDASGNAYVPDLDLQAFARQMASIRHSYRALQDGDVQHGLVINDAQQLYGFARTNGQQTALVLLNRGGASQSATFTGLNAAPYNLANGAVLLDAISGTTYTVTNGSVTVNATPSWGAVLLEQSKIDTPAAPALTATGSGADVKLTWPIVTSDSAGQPEVITSYQVYRNGAFLATVANPAFGGNPSYTDAGAAMGGYSYSVRACNTAGKCANSPAVSPTKQTATLSVSEATATYGGSVTLQATLSGGTNLASRAVTFTLNGAPAGTATTNSQGVATLTANLGGIGAGSYTGGVAASFAGDNAYNGANGSAALVVERAAATVTLGGLSATYDGAAKSATTTTSPAGLTVSLTYTQNGEPVAAPTNAGSYAVAATVVDNNYQGNATGTLVIEKATATLTLNNLEQGYTGAALPVEVLTDPADLAGVSVTYNGSPTAPTNAGSYAVVATLNNPNYTAANAIRTLAVAKAPATLTLSNLAHSYDGTGKAATVTTSPANLSGVSVTYDGGTALPVNVGSYAVVASLNNPNYTATNATGTLTIVTANQKITFDPLAAKTYGDPSFTVSATASSGLPVSFTASGSCTVTGSTVTITGAGSCKVTASQLGGGNYGAAAPVDQTFNIAKAEASISLSGLNATYDGTPKAVSVSTSPVNLIGVTVTYDGLTTAPTNAGSYAVVAKLVNPNYTAADVTGTLAIAKAPAKISLGELSQTYNGTPKAVEVVTTPPGLGGVTVSYNGSTTAPTNAGSYLVMARLNNLNYDLVDVTGTLVIAKAAATVSLTNATVTYTGGAQTLAATTTPAGLAVTYTYDGLTAPPINAGDYTVVAKVNDANYEGSATARLVVAKATATITLGGLSHIYNGSAKAATPTTDPASLNVSLTYSATPINADSYTVTATVVDDNYQGRATGTLVIEKANQTILLSGVPGSVTAGESFTVSASADSGLPVSLSVSGPCTLSGSVVTTAAAGSCTVTASQGGSDNYNAASSVSASATVNPAPVKFPFSGFFAPVDNPPTVNVVNAGRAIPVKFSLGGDRGLKIFESGFPAVSTITCSSAAPTDPIPDSQTVAAMANSLSYDPATGQYTFVWKTDKSFAGSCRQLVLKFTDGTTQTATFRFTR